MVVAVLAVFLLHSEPSILACVHDLPFAAGRDDLLTALRTRGAAVVQAPPGTGKTTLAPQYVLDHVQEQELAGRVIVTQPRRVAARSSAARIAELRGTDLGAEIGYTVRGDRKVSASTTIEMVTPGVLLRRLLTDPDLDGVCAVIIDEVHERHLESDLVFAMVTQLRELRDDLVVVAMSATLDAAHFADLLGGSDGDNSTEPAPLVDVPSPIHPLDIRYVTTAESMVNRDRRNRSAIEDIVLSTTRRALTATTGDVLVFVPTIRGTETVAAALSQDGVDSYALHGRLSPREQARIVRGHSSDGTGVRRVIVATDVAESSLTVPGVRVVVDACLSRVSRRDTTRGMSVLVTETASQSSMTQRAGRAGRDGPGTVYRCITAEQYAKAPVTSPPAVLTSDLTSAMLDVACWGSPRAADLPLPDPFPVLAADAAEETLHSIGAVDAEGAATSYGKRLARIPADPRLARGGLLAAERADATTVAKVLAVMDGGSGTIDALPDSRDPVVARFRRLVTEETAAGSTSDLHGTDAVAYTLACSFPGLIARRVSGDRFLTVSGTGAVFAGQVGRTSGAEWIAVADIAGASARTTDGAGAVIRAAVPLNRDLAFEAAAPLLTDEIVCTWTPGGASGKLQARRVRALGAIELVSTPVSVKDVSAADREDAVRAGLTQHGLGVLEWSRNAADLRRRIQYLHNNGVDGYPDVADAHRSEQLLDFVAPELAAGRRPDLAGLLRGVIPWNRPIDEHAPTTFELPGGRNVHIRYPEANAPVDAPAVIATKLQDCFGLHESPSIAGRRIQFQLLSPAQRPLAVTDDLASFWSGPYRQVRSDMRGRYPKHPWPEDPGLA